MRSNSPSLNPRPAYPFSDELEHNDAYHLPGSYDAPGTAPDKRYEVLTQRYREPEEDEVPDAPWAQQEAFEAEQIRKAVKTSAKAAQAPAYDYVFEDQVEFIVDQMLGGEGELLVSRGFVGARGVGGRGVLGKLRGGEHLLPMPGFVPVFDCSLSVGWIPVTRKCTDDGSGYLRRSRRRREMSRRRGSGRSGRQRPAPSSSRYKRTAGGCPCSPTGMCGGFGLTES